MRRGHEDENEQIYGLEYLENEDKSHKSRPFFLRPGILISLAVAVCALFIIGYAVTGYIRARAAYDSVRELVVRSVSDRYDGDDPLAERTEVSIERPEGAVLEIDFETLLSINEDVVAWLHVPSLDISYPVVQTTDDDFYLNHNLDKTKSAGGAIFLECRNIPYFTDSNSFVFGHNSKDGSMFGKLYEFGFKTELMEECPFFYLYFPDGTVGEYEIFSFYSAKSDSDSFVLVNDKSYDAYLEMILSLSVRETGADVSDKNNIVSLSTCFGSTGTTERFLVHGMRRN